MSVDESVTGRNRHRLIVVPYAYAALTYPLQWIVAIKNTECPLHPVTPRLSMSDPTR